MRAKTLGRRIMKLLSALAALLLAPAAALAQSQPPEIPFTASDFRTRPVMPAF
jgi:hypothetical protein